MKGVHQILLCGFMGCGKTSVGQALSFRLRWEFLDTDAMIEKQEGKSIPQIFSQQGEPAFRQMEQQVARGLGRRKNAVISTGGGFLMGGNGACPAGKCRGVGSGVFGLFV